MSQTKTVPQKLIIRNRTPGTLSTGMNTEVLLDGKPLKYVTFIKVEIKPKGVAKVLIELLADVEVDLDTTPKIE